MFGSKLGMVPCYCTTRLCGKRVIMQKNFVKVLLVSMALLLVGIVAAVIIPLNNEEAIHSKLEASFQDFKAVTVKNFPDQVTREGRLRAVLAEKDRITREGEWLFISCKARFVAHNAGTKRRRDAKYVTCDWSFFSS